VITPTITATVLALPHKCHAWIAGQCNDAFFTLSRDGKATYVLDSVDSLTAQGVLLSSGKQLNADIIIVASGCKFTKRPFFLEGVNTGTSMKFHGPAQLLGVCVQIKLQACSEMM
jgi:hypothetical protein